LNKWNSEGLKKTELSNKGKLIAGKKKVRCFVYFGYKKDEFVSEFCKQEVVMNSPIDDLGKVFARQIKTRGN
jgi:hypothetical protein